MSCNCKVVTHSQYHDYNQTERAVMTFSEYQKLTADTAVYTTMHIGNLPCPWVYPALGLAGESGEIIEKLKKLIRDKNGVVTDKDRDAISKECGDLLWYIARLTDDLGINLDDVAQQNLDKLAARKAAGTLNGSGDNR